jgi:hypothetical protein
MTTAHGISGVTQRDAARIAGYALLLIMPMAMFAFFFVLEKVVVPGNATETVGNIIASEGLFRFAIASFVLVVYLDIIVAWALYVLLEPVNRALSLLVAWLRLAYAVILGTAVADLLNVVRLLHAPVDSAQVDTSHLHTHMMTVIASFYDGWAIGLAVFGLHLMSLGYLFVKSGYIPRLVSVLVIIAGLGYILDSFGILVIAAYTLSLATYTFVGEVLLIFWLLARLGRREAGRLDQSSAF